MKSNLLYYLGLGANLGDPLSQLISARARIASSAGFLRASSSCFRTRAMLAPGALAADSPDYLNAVITVESPLAPQQMLDFVLDLEKCLGRARTAEARWASRLIDIDIIAVQDFIISTDRLEVPHPELAIRDFVLLPLAEVAPEWRHPKLDKTAEELLEQLKLNPSLETFSLGREVDPRWAGESFGQTSY